MGFVLAARCPGQLVSSLVSIEHRSYGIRAGGLVIGRGASCASLRVAQRLALLPCLLSAVC
jgi:hypothetical protein